MGMIVWAVHSSRTRRGVSPPAAVADLPACSNADTQRAMSRALERIPPAAAMLSASSGATVRSTPSTSAWGVAAFASLGRAEGLGTVPFISRGASRRSRTKASQVFPLTAATTSPATM
jgi:hypothetical protein